MVREQNKGARRRIAESLSGGALRRHHHAVPFRSEATGFSLVELVVCCALIGLLTLVSVHTLQGLLPAVRVHRALREIVDLLEWARWSAVRGGCVYRVIVNAEEAELTVFRETRDDMGKEALEQTRRLALKQAHPGVCFGTGDGVVRTSGCEAVDPSGVHFRDGTVRFLPSGTPDRCGSLYLIPRQDIPDRLDRMRAISILLTTGRLQTWAYDPLSKSECPNDGAWQPL